MNLAHERSRSVNFIALQVSLQFIETLRDPVAKLAQHDSSLADQVRRAASSAALNLGEGRKRAGKDRRQFWRVGAGSAEEARTALLVAEAWGYLEASALAAPLAVGDRLIGLLWGLCR